MGQKERATGGGCSKYGHSCRTGKMNGSSCTLLGGPGCQTEISSDCATGDRPKFHALCETEFGCPSGWNSCNGYKCYRGILDFTSEDKSQSALEEKCREAVPIGWVGRLALMASPEEKSCAAQDCVVTMQQNTRSTDGGCSKYGHMCRTGKMNGSLCTLLGGPDCETEISRDCTSGSRQKFHALCQIVPAFRCPSGWNSCNADDKCYKGILDLASDDKSQSALEETCREAAPAGWVGRLALMASPEEKACA